MAMTKCYGGAIEALDEAGKTGKAEALAVASAAALTGSSQLRPSPSFFSDSQALLFIFVDRDNVQVIES